MAPEASREAEPDPALGPMPRYRHLVQLGEIRADPAQRAAVGKLQLLHNRLVDYAPSSGKRVARGWFGFGRGAPHRMVSLTGLYLYGGVGRGKSMLMDLFFDGAPVRPKRRVHFHAFMREIHAGVHVARESGVNDPIASVADEVAEGATLLCFDEFQVSDITDAMILGRLFEALFQRGVVVVATSNRPPDDLYKDGWNRDQFLPFIALLKERVDVVELSSATDYRRGREGANRYFSPLGAAAAAAMDAAWMRETAGGAGEGKPLTFTIQGREVTIERAAGAVGRSDFAALCGRPLGAGDYLEIARRFDAFLIDGVPSMDRGRANEAKRFVTLIDAFYEKRIRLWISADAPPDRLYETGDGSFEFARTASRLEELTVDEAPGRAGALGASSLGASAVVAGALGTSVGER
ncbi:MAG: cell division protein ZapE [Pseudomonadota bacterium]